MKNNKNKNTNKIITIISLIIVITSIMFLTGCESQDESYEIGLVAPLSGAGAIYGDGYVRGAELALEEKKLVNGRELKLLVEDSMFDGKASVDAANYLLNIKNVDVLVSLFHLPANSINSLSREKQVPHIYEAMTTSLVEENPYAFKANFDALTGCEELLQFAKNNQEYENVGVLMAQTEYNQLCLQGMKKVEPNIKEYWYTFGDTDFKTMLTKMNNDGVDSLMTIMIDFEYLALFKQLTELGHPIKVMCATASECINPMIEKEIPTETLEGTLGIDILPDGVRETNFGKKYLERYPDAAFVELNYAIAGYEMIQYVSKAMETCEPKDSECLTQALKSVTGYETELDSTGFEDRVLQLENKLYAYNNGEWVLQE